MLVLSRRNGEAICVDTEFGQLLSFQVVAIAKGAVKLSFDAPREIYIRRAELPPKDKVLPSALHRRIAAVKDSADRDFIAEMCRQFDRFGTIAKAVATLFNVSDIEELLEQKDVHNATDEPKDRRSA